MRMSVVFIFVLLMATNVQAYTYEQLEYASEAPVTAFYIGKDLTGYVKNKYCPKCKEKMFKITPDIKAYLDNKEVSLKQFVMSKHKPSYLVFDKKTNKLIKMIWFSRK